ncbi:MAG: hypothetical protein L0216_20005 [Planctomycetales bacterium]|nr:hypothetical protein [Planctomycetales bacterium]
MIGLRYALGAAGLLLAGSPALADRVTLASGYHLEGAVTVRGNEVEIRLPSGRIVLPRSQVKEIVEEETPLEAFERRRGGLADEDLAGRIALALWARENGLGARADAELEAVLTRDPGNADAHRALGHVEHGGRWVTPEERSRLLGLVKVGDEWLNVEEAKLRLEERRVRIEEERARAEREILEARARAEEAEADRREAEAQDARLRLARGQPTYDTVYDTQSVVILHRGFPGRWSSGGCARPCAPVADPCPDTASAAGVTVRSQRIRVNPYASYQALAAARRAAQFAPHRVVRRALGELDDDCGDR